MSDFNEKEEMPEQLTLYFEGMRELEEEDRAYMEKKYDGVSEKLETIDAMLNQYSSGWKTSRMSKVDLNILRLAVYEMLYDETIPARVAINEAIEIAKSFGGEASASFVNGILGKIYRGQTNE